MATSPEMSYVAGACNIGADEIRMRLRSGWIGLGVTVVLEVVFVALRVAAPWRLTLFLPALMGAAGFLQAAFRFCAGFGLKGVFNFGSLGQASAVADAAARLADRRKAKKLGLYSALIGVGVALAGFLTGLL